MERSYYVQVEEKNLPIWPDYIRLDGSLESTGSEKSYSCDLATMYKGKVYRQTSWDNKTPREAFNLAYNMLQNMIASIPLDVNIQDQPIIEQISLLQEVIQESWHKINQLIRKSEKK